MKREIKCPKCGSEKRVKSGFNNKKQRYLCKECGCNYTGGRNGYPEHIRKKAIELYLEGNGFRRIERILKVSPQNEKVEVLELDELCVNFKKTFGSGQQ